MDIKKVDCPIIFASIMFYETEVKYLQIDKEASSIIWADKKFYLYFKDRTFTLITNHKPLILIFNLSK